MTHRSPRRPDGPPPIFPAGLVQELEFDDADAFAAAAPQWRQGYVQTGRGAFQGRLAAVHTPAMQIGFAHWSIALVSRGLVPRGTVTVALLQATGEAPAINARTVGADEAATASDRDEFVLATRGACSMLVLSLGRTLADGVSNALFGEPWEHPRAAGAAPVLRLRDGARVAAHLGALVNRVRRDPGTFARPEAMALAEELVTCDLLSALDRQPIAVDAPVRHRLARRAVDFLAANRDRPVTITELCAAVGSCERTLHLGFVELFGIGPIAYQRRMRLQGARRELRTAAFPTTVTDVATRWGFFHFGEFAAAYRRAFGERPSETLRRGSAG